MLFLFLLLFDALYYVMSDEISTYNTHLVNVVTIETIHQWLIHERNY